MAIKQRQNSSLFRTKQAQYLTTENVIIKCNQQKTLIILIVVNKYDSTFVHIMKPFFSIAFTLFLSTLLLVETIGVYITKDTCDPCGTSNIAVEMIKLSNSQVECQHEHADHNDLLAASCCTDPSHHVPQNAKHHHHQEQHFFNQAPVFFSAIDRLDFSPKEMAVLMPFTSTFIENQESQRLDYGDTPPPLISQRDNYCSFLCTYLI